MKILIYIILTSVIWVSLTSLTIRGYKIAPHNIYESAKDVKIIDYIGADSSERFVLKCSGIKDTIGILYSHFYPADNEKPIIKNSDNWSITIFIHGKGRVSYAPWTKLKDMKYPDIYTSEVNNINYWLKQVDIYELISQHKLSYFSQENMYGLYFFYYLLPDNKVK